MQTNSVKAMQFDVCTKAVDKRQKMKYYNDLVKWKPSKIKKTSSRNQINSWESSNRNFTFYRICNYSPINHVAIIHTKKKKC